MKHDLYITLALIILFLGSHVIGLFVIKNYLPAEEQLPLGIEKPEFDEKTSYIPIIISLVIATIIALVLIKFKALKVWKTWFFLSIAVTLVISFSAFIPQILALILAVVFALIRIFKPNVIIHNFTELFVYGGLAAIFVPILSVLSIFILLILISIYDMIAVWKTKHMVSMAQFQAKSKIFAGLFVQYKSKETPVVEETKSTKKKVEIKEKGEYREAILGGGDIAFPLLFSGVMLKNFGFIPALITSLTAALALLILFMLADKKKFYPAMPPISLGCLLGYIIVILAF